jgi:hypothetical protein
MGRCEPINCPPGLHFNFIRQVYKFDEGAEENVYAVVLLSFLACQLSIATEPLMLRSAGSSWLSQGRLDTCKGLRLARMCTFSCVNRRMVICELILAQKSLQRIAVMSLKMRLVINVNGIIMNEGVPSCKLINVIMFSVRSVPSPCF